MALLAGLWNAGCARSPIAWDAEETRIADTTVAPMDPASLRMVPWANRVTVGERWVHACGESIRAATQHPGTSPLFAAWWAVRADSGSDLLLSRSDDGVIWGAPHIVDSTDAATRGCDRPAPAIAADALGRYVYLAYFAEPPPPSGAGVFFAHLMDGMIHSPVAVIYGERPVHVAIAGEGDTVAVAYEDPNVPRPAVALALSRTAGHLFEHRLTVVGGDRRGERPGVTLAGRTIVVTWLDSHAVLSRRGTLR